MSPKELEEYYKRLTRKGQATLKVIFKAAPQDDFSSDDPVANVTVVAKDPTTGEEIFRDAWQMSASAREHEVEIKILNVLGVFKSMWYRIRGKERPKPYDVTIIVEPHQDWTGSYSRKEFPVKVKLGGNSPEHVWMLPKRSKLSASSKLDKPSPPKGNS